MSTQNLTATSGNSSPGKCVMFADIAGSTKLYRRVGDARAQQIVGDALQQATEFTQRHHGIVVKTLGDAVMCVFDSVSAAAQAAIEVQTGAGAGQDPDGERVQFRIGFAFGPVVERDDDYFGDAVNIAARLSDMAKAGQILSTEASAAHLTPDLRRSVRLFDRTPVKGVTESIVVVQVLWGRHTHTEMLDTGGVIGALALELRYKDRVVKLAPTDLPYTIGREVGCTLVVPGQFASREHARIEYRRGKFVLVDESTNGTYVHMDASDAPLTYIRNESLALFGSGSFSLGTQPDGDEHIITFAVS